MDAIAIAGMIRILPMRLNMIGPFSVGSRCRIKVLLRCVTMVVLILQKVNH